MSEMHEMYDKMMKRGSYLWKMQDQNQRKSGKSFWVILDDEETEWIERDPEKWVRNCAERLNRNLRFKNVSFSYRRAIEDLTRGVQTKILDGSRELSRNYREVRKFLDGSK